MPKYKVTKRYSLEPLGKDWADCFLEFYPLTIRDLEKLGSLAQLDEKNPEEVLKSSNVMLEVLQDHFVDGTAISAERGQKVTVHAEDLTDFPIEVIGGVVAFLSQSQAVTS